jgi:glycerol-3-phosphate dehydrogenase
MAKATADLICKKLAVNATCATDTTPLQQPAQVEVVHDAEELLPAAAVEKARRRLGSRLEQVVSSIHANPLLAEIVCECELVTRAELDIALGESCAVPALTIGDVGRRTRLGFGPCQGTFCGYKAMLAGYQNQKWSADEASGLLDTYLHDRWKGQAWVPNGKQAEQLSLSQELFGPACDGADRNEVTSHER